MLPCSTNVLHVFPVWEGGVSQKTKQISQEDHKYNCDHQWSFVLTCGPVVSWFVPTLMNQTEKAEEESLHKQHTHINLKLHTKNFKQPHPKIEILKKKKNFPIPTVAFPPNAPKPNRTVSRCLLLSPPSQADCPQLRENTCELNVISTGESCSC